MPQRELVADVVVGRAPEHGVINVFERRLEMLVGAEVFECRGCRRADDEPAEREHSAQGCPHSLMLCAYRAALTDALVPRQIAGWATGLYWKPL